MELIDRMELNDLIEQARQDNPGKRVDCYVLFASHTDAMELFGLVREAGLGARISTTPRQARSCCGVSLLIGCDDAARVELIARENGVPTEGIVPLPNQIDPNRDVYC